MKRQTTLILAGLFLVSLLSLPGCGDEEKKDDDNNIAPDPPELGSIELYSPWRNSEGDTVVASLGDVGVSIEVIETPSEIDTYLWSVSEGSIGSSSADSVGWIAPASAALCTLRVVVTTLAGGQEMAQRLIRVDDGLPDRASFPSPIPGDAEISLHPTLGWESEHPDNAPLRYELYFGLASAGDPALVTGQLDSSSWTPATPLQPSSSYQWRVNVRDDDGDLALGALWHFSTESLTDGPPFYEIAFLNYGGFLATNQLSAGSALYVPGVGPGGLLPAPGPEILIQPTATANEGLFLLYDSETEELVFVDETGATPLRLPALEQLYTFKPNGGRISYVREIEGRQALIERQIPPFVAQTILDTLETGWSFLSKPSYRGDALAERIAISVADPTMQQGELRFYRPGDNAEPTTRDLLAYSPSFSHDGSRIAYIPVSNNNELVVLDQDLNEIQRSAFGDIAPGAWSLAWSPDDNFIALFSGNLANDPTLLLVPIGEPSAQPLEVLVPGRRILLGEQETARSARPAWNAGSSSMALLAERVETGQRELITINLNGTISIIDSNVRELSLPAWRR